MLGVYVCPWRYIYSFAAYVSAYPWSDTDRDSWLKKKKTSDILIYIFINFFATSLYMFGYLHKVHQASKIINQVQKQTKKMKKRKKKR